MLRHVDLCSGIGGFAYAFQTVGLSKPVLFCDIEPWSRQILAKHWPDVPIAEDVKELANDPTRIIHAIGDRRSILSCGYPCQPFSQAGQRRGSEDDRHIWPEIFSIVQQVRPDWIVCENVSGHITMGLNEVLSDLADKANYAVQTFHLGAVSVDAPHRRMRLWIVARNVGNSNNNGTSTSRDFGFVQRKQEWQKKAFQQPTRSSEPRDSGSVGESARTTDVADARRKPTRGAAQSERSSSYATRRSSRLNPRNSEISPSCDVPNTDSKLRETQHQRSVLGKQNTEGSARGHSDEGLQGNRQWKPQSKLGGMADGLSRWVDEPRDIPRVSQGVPNRVQRLKGLGNAILPQIAMRIGQTIKATYDA